jgi:hypothetical protein
MLCQGGRQDYLRELNRSISGDTVSRSKTAGVITNGVLPIKIQWPNRRPVDQEPFSL